MTIKVLASTFFLLSLACVGAAGDSIDITTDGSTPWKVNVPSQGISNATPHSGYLTTSITPFGGDGGCISSTCTSTFDGFWTATLTFTLPSDATDIDLDFSGLDADDRAVLELNGNIIGNGYSGTAAQAGNMTFTDKGVNEVYEFGGAASESGSVTSGFDLGGSNTLTLIVNNTQSGIGGGLTGDGFTAASVLGSITYETGATSPVPEPASAFFVVAGIPLAAILRRRQLKTR